MIGVSTAERRRLLVRRQLQLGEANTVEQVATSLIGLHATEPASIHLAVLARSRDSTLADVDAALHERRSLVRWMAMRRTLFALPRDLVPVVQAAAGRAVADQMRRQLIRRLELNGTEPPIPHDDVRGWLSDVEDAVENTLRSRGRADGRQLGQAVPRLRAVIPARLPSEIRQTTTSFVLALMGAEGRIVRGATDGDWTSRRHHWEPVQAFWPQGLPDVDVEQARADLVRRWLATFGPATLDDVRWWTSWNLGTTRAALARVATIEVDLDGAPGVALDDGSLEHDLAEPAPPPTATLLPTLDATPMGWKNREWFLGVDRRQLFDTRGNIGPSVWWNGEIVGGWAVTPDGEIRTAVLADRGTAAVAAVEQAAQRLRTRLDGAVVTSSMKFPLHRTLLGDR